jgi:hypothetical protein
MIQNALKQLMNSYRSFGPPGWREAPLLRGEIPLHPPDAIRLADDLEVLGIPIMGLDGWSYTLDGQYVFETLFHYYVGDDVLSSPDAVQRSVSLIKEFIATQLPDHIPLVAFTLQMTYGEAEQGSM